MFIYNSQFYAIYLLLYIWKIKTFRQGGGEMNKRLSRRVTAGIFAAIIITAGLLLFFIIRVEILLRRAAENEAFLNTKQAAASAEERVTGVQQLLYGYTAEIMGRGLSSPEEIIEYLNLCGSAQDFVRMGYVKADGTAYNTDLGELGDFSGKFWVEETMKKCAPYVSEPKKDRFSVDRKIIVFTVPFERGGKADGMIYAIEEASDISGWFSRSVCGDKGKTAVISSDDSVVFSHEGVWDGKLYGQVVQDEKTEASLRTLVEVEKNGSCRGKLDGEEVIFSACPLSFKKDWLMISAVPEEALLDNSNTVLRQISVVSAMIVLFIACFAAYMLWIQRRKDRETRQLAFTDKLTGLDNAGMFHIHLQNALSDKKNKYALIYMDLDNFKMFNDICGYAAGDQLLIKIAEILRRTLRNGEKFARMFNDYFAILMEYESKQTVVDAITSLEEQIRSANYMQEGNLNTVISAGIYLIREEDNDIYQIINRANIAQSMIKGHGQRFYAFYNERMHDTITQDTLLDNEIRTGIASGQFEVYYQPKIDLKDNRLCGAEALLRWNHPEKGLLLPGSFIPAAEKSGLIVELGRWCFERVLGDISELTANGYNLVPISVNFSKAELYQPDMIDFIKNALKVYDIKGPQIEIEITETSELTNVNYTISLIKRIRAMGMKVSLDDFGTGYSSLSYLKSIPVNILKLDKSFVDNLECNNVNKNIINAMIALAKSLELQVVSEGVETQSQMNFVRECGADVAQGFYFYRPMPLDKFIAEFFEGK